MSVENSSEGGWSGGWVISAAAGVIAAILARGIGDAPMPAAVMVGLVVLLVFGVLLGMFWSVAGGHDDHGHGPTGHGHDHHAPTTTSMPAAAAPSPMAHAAPVSKPAMEATPLAAPAPVAAPEPVLTARAEEPTPAVAVEMAEAKPVGLAAPRDGNGDDLQVLEGIGPAMEKLCHDLGIFHFDQIAAWGPGEVAWMDGNLKGFKGRVTRDKWVRQAKLIGEVGIAEFERRAKTNDY